MSTLNSQLVRYCMLGTTLVSMNSIIECKQVIFSALFVRDNQDNNSLYNKE